MDLQFLGCGGAFNTALGNTAACIRRGAELLLLYCGETVFETLRARGLLDGLTRLVVFISHLHGDHCGSLGTLGFYCQYILHIRMEIAMPDNAQYREQLATLLQLNGTIQGESYTFIPSEEVRDFVGVKCIAYVPTEHADGMLCHSFALDTEDGAVFFSADTRTTATLMDFIVAHPDFSAAYMDASDVDYPGSVHLCIAKLAEVVPEALRSRIHLMHLNRAECADAGRLLGFNVANSGI